MTFRPQFKQALGLLAKAIASMSRNGYEPPILVGGGAVEFYTGSAVTSGDFDLVTPHSSALEEALRSVGFVRISEPGFSSRSFMNRQLGFAVDVVSGILMDGRTDPEKTLVVEIDGTSLRIISIEDLIADRMGQAYSQMPPRRDMLDQASLLLQFAKSVDEMYLDRRIREETLESASLRELERYGK